MADKNILEQMLGHLVNNNQAKADELFHEYVVAKSREIYETLIEAEMQDEEEEVEEGADKEEDENEEQVEEAFGEEEEFGGDEFGGDATDDLAGEMGPEEGEMGEEPAEEGEEQLFQDLEAIVDELQAKFDELKGIETDEHGAEFGDEEGEEGGFGEEEPEEGFEPEMATVREYVEKVGTAKMGDNGANAKSVVAGKNDMGGTTANILSGKNGQDAGEWGTAGGQLKGNGVFKGGKPTEENFGNVNVPGGNAGKTGFKKKEPGHGAEKKGEAEGKFSGTGGSSGAVDKASLFRGRR